MVRGRKVVVGLLVILVLSLGLWRWTKSSPSGSDSGRNVILILVDTLRADHVGLYGYDVRETTPNIDRLGRSGRWFSQAFSAAPWTVPSVMSLMTSKFPSSHGFNLEGHRYTEAIPRLTPSITTLAEVLRDNGWKTVAVTGGGGVGSAYGFDRGFDHYWEPKSVDGEDVAEGVDRAIEWVERLGDERFFLFFHTYEVHLPNTHAVYPLEGSPAEKAAAAYDGDLVTADAHIGRLLDTLVRRDDHDRGQVIIVTADHGENLHDRILGGRPVEHGHHLHNELLRVPLIVVAPGLVPPEGAIESPVQLTDVAPTVLSLVGLSGDGVGFQGVDLGGRLQGRQDGEADRPVFAEAPLQGRLWHSIMVGNTKYMVTPPVDGDQWWNRIRIDPKAFYLLDGDSFEEHNVLGQHPETAGDLDRRLRRFIDANRAERERMGPQPLVPVETESALIELGYVEPSPNPSPNPSPRTNEPQRHGEHRETQRRDGG